MPLLKTLLALAFIMTGIVFGALNRDPMRVDLFFTTIQSSIGLGVLLVLLLGCLMGGLVVLATVVWPMRTALSKAEKAIAKNSLEGNTTP
jgi:lipopolysaccharide assembly protein A